jgi:hypothetical protein
VQPAWIARVVASIGEKHQLARVTFAAIPRPTPAPLLARWFHRVDDAVYGRAPDGLTPTKIAAPAENRDADIIISFVPFASDDTEVWTIDRDGLWEFVTRQPVMHAALVSRGRVLTRTSAKPDLISFRRAMSHLSLRIASMIEHQLDRRARACAAPATEAAPRQPRTVSSSRFVGVAARSARAWLRQQYRDRSTDLQWMIAFSFGAALASSFDFARFHRIEPPRDRLWADPFVIADGDRAWIFVEEMLFREGRGTIGVLEVRRDGTWTAPQRILARPYHLSYPCVCSWNGSYYMLPESQENRTIELYRCVEFPYRWEPDTVLFRDLSAVDATLFEAHGRWWLYFSTDSGDAQGFDRLWLYHAPTPRGPWTGHAWNPLECNVEGGRPGGRPFMKDGRLLRATQIGAPWYGHAIRLREIVTLTPDHWLERDVDTIAPTWMPGIIGTHTLNVDGEVAVIDAVRERT